MNFVEFQDLLALPFVVSKKGSMFQRPSGPAIRGIQEGEYVSKTFWPCPSWVSKKGNHLLQFMISSLFFSHLFRLS